MDVRRGLTAALVGLALVAGTTGCSKIGEKVAEEAIEGQGDCTNVDIDADEGGFSGSCGGEDIDVNASGGAELPADWPTDLATPDGFAITASTGTDTPVRSIEVIGTVEGDVAATYDTVKTQLTTAGFTIDTDSLVDGPTGPTGNLLATGPDFTGTVTVTGNVSGIGGNVLVTYSLNAAG